MSLLVVGVLVVCVVFVIVLYVVVIIIVEKSVVQTSTEVFKLRDLDNVQGRFFLTLPQVKKEKHTG